MTENKRVSKNKKKQAIIAAARTLFMRYGIKRVTVEEICETAGASKMTFYKHFNNKLDLAIYILDEIFVEGVSRYKSIMGRDIPYSEKAKDIIKLKLESTEDISKEMLKDFYDRSMPEVTELIQKFNRENLNLLLDDMIAAQKKGDIRRDINPHFIIYMLGQMQKMSTDETLLSTYGSTQALASEFINFFFYGILPRDVE